MQSSKIFLAVIFGIWVLTVLIFYIKSKKFFTALFFCALQGVCALFAVNILGSFISIHLPINGWTIGISSFAGVSGVIMLLLCDTFLS